ncbi:MAG: hydroxyisourate hydrolase [Candidatus Acidiferrales bacterium]
MSSSITTHILDTSLGRPAQGVEVTLEMETSAGWETLGRGTSDADGRVSNLLAAGQLVPATYRLRFATGPYFLARRVVSFFPQVEITFLVQDAKQHYHVPLLLNPFGYTSYRGS